MPITSRTVQIKLPPKTYLKLVKFGIAHGFLSESDPPFGGRAARRIIEFVLKMDADPGVQKIKEEEGGNTLDIIQRVIHQRNKGTKERTKEVRQV